MTPLDFDLIQKVCQIIACKHAEDISAAHLDQWPRVMRLSCPTCQTTILIKQFSRDFGVNRQEQRRRFQIERKSFETLCSFGLADGKERIPRVLGYIEDPHFAIVEEYCDYGELLKTITSAFLTLLSALGLRINENRCAATFFRRFAERPDADRVSPGFVWICTR